MIFVKIPATTKPVVFEQAAWPGVQYAITPGSCPSAKGRSSPYVLNEIRDVSLIRFLPDPCQRRLCRKTLCDDIVSSVPLAAHPCKARSQPGLVLGITKSDWQPSTKVLSWYMTSEQEDSITESERQSLIAEIAAAGAQVIVAQRLLDNAANTRRARHSLITWTAILDSRVARLKSIQRQYCISHLPVRFPLPVVVQYPCTAPGCPLRALASTNESGRRCPFGSQGASS